MESFDFINYVQKTSAKLTKAQRQEIKILTQQMMYHNVNVALAQFREKMNEDKLKVIDDICQGYQINPNKQRTFTKEGVDLVADVADPDIMPSNLEIYKKFIEKNYSDQYVHMLLDTKEETTNDLISEQSIINFYKEMVDKHPDIVSDIEQFSGIDINELVKMYNSNGGETKTE